MDDYLDAIREQATTFGAGWSDKYDESTSYAPEQPWTPEEAAAFAGHQWVERRVVQVQGRLFADLMNILNPRELREAQAIPASWRTVVARVIYRDNEEWHGTYASDEMAVKCQPWFLGWQK